VDTPQTVLFDQIIRPGQPPVGFDVHLDTGARVELQTDPLANNNYDWSYWGQLKFVGGLDATQRLGKDLIGSDVKLKATFDGQEIFAHAPTTLSAKVTQAIRLHGVAGLKPQPPGTDPGDGVRYTIRTIAPGGGVSVVFDKIITPGKPALPFDLKLTPGTQLQLQTDPLTNNNYDWSYWGKLKADPQNARSAGQ
jgi:hypothetical protein